MVGKTTTCKSCRGSGKVRKWGQGMVTCVACSGKGYVIISNV